MSPFSQITFPFELAFFLFFRSPPFIFSLGPSYLSPNLRLFIWSVWPNISERFPIWFPALSLFFFRFVTLGYPKRHKSFDVKTHLLWSRSQSFSVVRHPPSFLDMPLFAAPHQVWQAFDSRKGPRSASHRDTRGGNPLYSN